MFFRQLGVKCSCKLQVLEASDREKGTHSIDMKVLGRIGGQEDPEFVALEGNWMRVR